MADDKRRATRARVLKAAKLVNMNEWTYVDGVVRDYSDSGAKIACADSLSIPEEFRLLILQDNTIRSCKVTWRRDRLIGVTFTGETKRAPTRKF